ncbi:LysR substrate-binding domain-containing protein [Streptomyces decoyicus]|uniref:LysR substrate-binding domain-containing protein n=1 Tax=Streptomyces decoyicus TaxID=249567 RepID=UPI00362BCB11
MALPARHPLADRAGLRLADLADARWIDAPDTAIPLAQLRAASGSDGYRTSLRHEGTDVRGLTALIAAGHGLALLPRGALDDQPGIHAVPSAHHVWSTAPRHCTTRCRTDRRLGSPLPSWRLPDGRASTRGRSDGRAGEVGLARE